MNPPLDTDELDAIVDILFAMADDFFVGDPAELGPLNDSQTWRDWIQQNAAQAEAFETAIDAAKATDNTARAIARAHAAAADAVVNVPTADLVENVVEALKRIDHLVQNDEAFHAALAVTESLADAIPQGAGEAPKASAKPGK